MRYSDSTAVRYDSVRPAEGTGTIQSARSSADPSQSKSSDDDLAESASDTFVKHTLKPTATSAASSAASVSTSAPIDIDDILGVADAETDANFATLVAPAGDLRAFNPNPTIYFYFSQDNSDLTVDVGGNVPVTIGRGTADSPLVSASPSSPDATNALYFDCKVLSRAHCEFGKDEAGYYVMDIGSSSSTFVNGERLSMPKERSRKHYLQPMDVVQAGVSVQQDGQLVPNGGDDGAVPEDRRAIVFKAFFEVSIATKETWLCLTVSAKYAVAAVKEAQQAFKTAK